MLKQLKIADFAIISQVDVDFLSGMTCLTGQTGAGKSILLDALALVLGDRADSDSVKTPAARADISASFDISALPIVQNALCELELDADDDCILRRVIRAEGGSKAYINGSLVNSQTLKTIGALLVDIHGQHAHQALLNKSHQRQRLDEAGKLAAPVAALKTVYQQYRQQEEILAARQSAKAQSQQRRELLDFQIHSLAAENPEEGQWQQISSEHQRLAHAEHFLGKTQQALVALGDGEDFNVHHALSSQINNLQSIVALDASLKPALDSLNEALILCQDAYAHVQDYAAHIELDPARLQFVDARMASLHALAKRYNVAPEALPALLKTWQQERQALEHESEDIAALVQQVADLKQQYLNQSQALHQLRKKAGQNLAQKITAAMAVLGMAGRFEIEVRYCADKFASHGQDEIDMLVSTNAGMAPKSLSKVASGGELSRISLAIQMVTQSAEHTPTLIFDEVDAGIGGAVAQIVGEQLRALATHRQVLCVTHLPQVASCAHQHLLVEKNQQDSTSSHIRLLSDDERVLETARMLGGIDISPTTLEHAKEMLQNASAQDAR